MPKCNEKQIVIIVYCAKNNIYASQKVMFKLGKMQKVSLNSLKKIVIQTALLFFFFQLNVQDPLKQGMVTNTCPTYITNTWPTWMVITYIFSLVQC